VTRKSWFDSPQEQGYSFRQEELEIFIKAQKLIAKDRDREREREREREKTRDGFYLTSLPITKVIGR